MLILVGYVLGKAIEWTVQAIAWAFIISVAIVLIVAYLVGLLLCILILAIASLFTRKPVTQ